MIDKLEYLDKEKKFPMAFTINVMKKIQDEYGTLGNWSNVLNKDEEPNIKALMFFIYHVIHEGIEIESENFKANSNANSKVEIDELNFPTKKEIGRIISKIGILKVSEKVRILVENSTKTDDEIDDDEETGKNKKNVKTMQK